MAFVVLKEKRAADKVRDFTSAFAPDLVCSVRLGSISSQPFLQVDDFRLWRVSDLYSAFFRDEDEITLFQVPPYFQFIDLKICRPFYQNEKWHTNLLRNKKTPWRADLNRTRDRAPDTNGV